MAIYARSRTVAGLGGVALVAVWAFHAVAQPAPEIPDRVFLGTSSMAWSTVKYATDAENGFVGGSLDKTMMSIVPFRPT